MKELITKESLFVKSEEGQMVLSENAIDVIRGIELQKKEIEKQYKKYRKALLDGMEAYGLTKVDTEDLLVTYVPETERVSIDTDKLWKEHKDVAFKCQKISDVKASVRVTPR